MVRPCALPHVITPARIPLQAEKRRGWATGNDVEYRDEGPMGAGWSWNLDERVIQGDCNLWTVVTGSGSQTFRRLETNGPFEAEKGYHAKLALVSDELVFTDLSNTKHFFRHAGHDGEWRLDRVVEPHGDRLVPTYDGHGLLVEMAEMAAEDLTRPVRRLLFNYQFIAGSYRLTSVVSGGSPAQDVEVRVVYGYDERYGNLIAVRREDVHDAELPIEERYTYTGDARPDDPHQLVRVEDANAAETGGKTEYEY